MHEEEKRIRRRCKRKVKFARKLRTTMTQAENLLWQALRARRFRHIKFRRQVPVGPFVADFLSYERSLIIEVDGGIHLEQQEYDDDRTTYLNGRGYTVMRFTNDQVIENLPSILDTITAHLHNKTVNNIHSPSPGR